MTPYRPPEPPPGARTLGRYLLRGKLAQGRLGPVWRAGFQEQRRGSLR